MKVSFGHSEFEGPWVNPMSYLKKIEYMGLELRRLQSNTCVGHQWLGDNRSHGNQWDYPGECIECRAQWSGMVP